MSDQRAVVHVVTTHDEAERLWGSDYDAQCARCGSSLDHVDCDGCGGDGFTDQEDDEGGAYEEPCDFCQGDGSWPVCLSSVAWCEANPAPGREGITRSTPEFFPITGGVA